MSLAEMKWTRVSLHEVVLGWLISERSTQLAKIPSILPSLMIERGLSRLLVDANLEDPQENHARLRLLYLTRNKFFGEIPPDTEWYKVESLTDNELSELHVIGRCGWDDPGDRNELKKVSERKLELLDADPSKWGAIILWGHNQEGPFTIVEGNHRLVAHVRDVGTDLNIPVFVGLSAMSFYFHLLDEPNILIYDLWR